MGRTGEGDRWQCGGCKRWVSRANYARHVRMCGRVEVAGRDVGVGIRRGGLVRMVTCGGCGREMRAGNLATHQRGRAEYGTREVGNKPLTGVDGPMDGWRCQTVLEPLVDMQWEHLADVWVEPGKCGFSCDALYTKVKKTDPEAHPREIAERALEEAGRGCRLVI